MDSETKNAIENLGKLMQQIEKGIEEKIESLKETISHALNGNDVAHDKIREDIKEHYKSIESIGRDILLIDNKAEKAHDRIDIIEKRESEKTGNKKWSAEMIILIIGIFISAALSALVLIFN